VKLEVVGEVTEILALVIDLALWSFVLGRTQLSFEAVEEMRDRK